uniref:Putative P-type ATPase, subfamily IV n=1 Tax=Helianthus annuus TaxID=4232 RepID=A0A251TVY5_HELAN
MIIHECCQRAIFYLASSGLFWVCLVGILIASMIPRFIVKMFMQHCKPCDIQIAREAEKFRNSMEITRSGEIEMNR